MNEQHIKIVLRGTSTTLEEVLNDIEELLIDRQIDKQDIDFWIG